MKKKAIIVSGYFNPLHKGHLEYFIGASKLADKLFVIVNNDHQRALKQSKEFQLEDERMLIVSSLRVVDKAILSIDTDRTVCKTICKHSQRVWARVRSGLCQWWRSKQRYHSRKTNMPANGYYPFGRPWRQNTI